MKLKTLASKFAVTGCCFLVGIILGGMAQKEIEATKKYRTSMLRVTTNYDDWVFPGFGDATTILIEMRNVIENYGCTSIADLCDLVGKQSSYIDNKYGWLNLDKARVERVKNGYKIRFPVTTFLPLN